MARARAAYEAQCEAQGTAPDPAFLADLRSQRARRAKIDVARVEELMLARQEARVSKDFARSDSLRQEIADLGVSVRDTPEGQVWDLE